MELHEHQQDAIDAMVAAVERCYAVLIKGKAGTGKSTVVKHGLAAIEEVAEGRDIISCAFTNKAVGRMVEIGFPEKNAMTCHALLYDTQVLCCVGGFHLGLVNDIQIESASVSAAMKLMRKHKTTEAIDSIVPLITLNDDIKRQDGREIGDEELENAARLFLLAVTRGDFETKTITVLKSEYDRSDIIIVDEVGMLPLDMADTIKERYDTVIFMGDHRQLPPIEGADTINVIDVYDTVELTHVFRSDDKVLKWADIAEKDELGSFPNISIRSMPELASDDWQVIVYTNADVFNVSHGIRANAGIVGRPQPGEPLIAFSAMTAINKIEDTRDAAEDLKQSHIDAGQKPPFTIESNPKDPDQVWRCYRKRITKNSTFKATGPAFEYQGDIYIGVDLGDGLEWYAETIDFWNLNPGEFKTARSTGMLNCFFAYAITCHRAQGSEMQNVLVKVRDRVTEQWSRDPSRANMERPRWNYTAITRGKESAVLCGDIIP